MQKLRTALALVAINLGLLLVVLWSLNLLASIGLDLRHRLEATFVAEDSRAQLPNYAGSRSETETIFREFRDLRTVYAPYQGWSRAPYQGEVTTVGPDGDRLHAATTVDPVATVRFFGGSTIWGTGVTDQGTIPALFNATFPELAVFNHGESGYVSRQGLARLVNLVNQGAPMDWVVFYDGFNEVLYHCRPEVSINGHGRAARIAGLLTPSSHVANDLFGSLRTVLAFLTRKAPWRKPATSRCYDDPDYARRIAATLIENWRIARAVARVGGAEFLAVLQPVAAFGTPRVDHLEIKERDLRNFAEVYPVIRESIAAEALPWVIDMTEIFDGDDLLYVDTCHVTRDGNRRVAAALAAVATEAGLRDRFVRGAAAAAAPGS
jgi:lysophospholipase L1-like esterase